MLKSHERLLNDLAALPIPTEAEWGISQGIDEEYSKKIFMGKSFSEAIQTFTTSCNAIEELTYMPPDPIEYYFPALCAYLLSEESRGDSDSASRFLTFCHREFELICYTHNHYLAKITLKYISKNQERFDADPKIYGDFYTIALEALPLFSNRKTLYRDELIAIPTE